MTNAKRKTATLVAEVVQGAAMSVLELELAKNDAVIFKSSKQSRKELCAAWIAHVPPRTVADWAKPEGDACPKFYNELRAISKSAADETVSSLGLTTQEAATLPEGVYSVGTVTDSEVKPSQLPDWATEPNRIGKLSIRRYHQMQQMGWFKSTLKSMERLVAATALVSGGANELTKLKAQSTIDDLYKAIKREGNLAADADAILTGKQILVLWDVMADIGNRHDGVKVPVRDDS